MKQRLAIFLVCMLLVGMMAGCGKAESVSSSSAARDPVPAETDIYRTITGIDPELPVMWADGISVPAELYCYWQIYNASLMEYRVYTYAETQEEFKSIMGKEGYLNWDAPFGGYDTLREYLNKQTNDTVRYYMAMEAIAAENGLTLDESDQKQLEAERQELVNSLGSEEAFQNYLNEMGISRENFDRVSAYPFWYDKLFALAETEGSDFYISLDQLNEYGLFTDHIYLSKVDLANFQPLPDEELAQKKEQAESMVKEITTAKDPAAAFTALADEKSEDPYRQKYPDGYVYPPETMNKAYEAAAKELSPGQVSGVVEGETGYYIILRKDLKEKLMADADETATLRDDYLQDTIVARSEQMEVTTAAELEQLDVETLYTAYIGLSEGRFS